MVFNAIVYLVSVLLASFAALVWVSPDVADWVILKLRARAAAVRAARDAYRAAYKAVHQEAQ